MGRPKKGQEHPRAKDAERISLLTAIGVPQSQIARMLHMSFETMHKHYKDALELGGAEASEVVGGKIFSAAKKGEPWACTLWAARRMGWKETNVSEHTGKDGKPIEFEVKPSDKLRAFLDAKSG